jgi:hypothetical protein
LLLSCEIIDVLWPGVIREEMMQYLRRKLLLQQHLTLI